MKRDQTKYSHLESYVLSETGNLNYEMIATTNILFFLH